MLVAKLLQEKKDSVNCLWFLLHLYKMKSGTFINVFGLFY